MTGGRKVAPDANISTSSSSSKEPPPPSVAAQEQVVVPCHPPVEEGPFLHKLTDEGIAKYIEFPDDVTFMQSAASNDKFRPGVAYIPVKRSVGWKNKTAGAVPKPQSFVYMISPALKKAQLVLGPLTTPDGSTDITILGSALSSKGILYLCCQNRNSILVYDLVKCGSPPPSPSPSAPPSPSASPPPSPKPRGRGGGGGGGAVAAAAGGRRASVVPPQKKKPFMEIPGIASPHDICIDQNDESTLYVAGGSFKRFCSYCDFTFNKAARGQVYEIKCKASTHEIIASGLDILAGIEMLDGKIWIAQLHNVITIDQLVLQEVEEVWSGNNGKGEVWLANNVCRFPSNNDDDNPYVLYPASNSIPESEVWNLSHRGCLTSTRDYWFKFFQKREPVIDSDVTLTFNNTYIPEENKDYTPPPIRLVFREQPTIAATAAGTAAKDSPPQTNNAYHFEIDLVETRRNHEPYYAVRDHESGKYLAHRHYFNEQVTHTSYIVDHHHHNATSGRRQQGYILCINFEQTRVLLLKDDPFREVLNNQNNKHKSNKNDDDNNGNGNDDDDGTAKDQE